MSKNNRQPTSMNKPNCNEAFIPDPEEWIKEHYILASFAHTLTTLKQLLLDEGFHADQHIAYNHEGELVIGSEARDLLKDSYGEEHWRYVENYLWVGES